MDTLSLLLALAGTLATASGCSLRYDPEDLGDDGGEDDDGGTEPDAGPDDLFVNRVFPPEVFEGQGFALDPDDEPDVRAIPVVLYGQNMTADTRVTVTGDGILSQEVAAQVSGDGRLAAFELRVPVIEADEEARDVELVVEVARGSETHQRTVVHHLLPEYDLETDNGSIMTDSLAVDASGVAHFSSVSLRGNVGTLGSVPLRMVGYSGITMSGLLRANGNGITPGAGGCAGGAKGEAAPCGAGSGEPGGPGLLAGVGGGGGGGGAFGPVPAAARGGGPADQQGDPGEPTGVPSLVPMPPEGIRGAGGGGGGQALGDQGGGVGGGSGGVIELTTPGLLRLSGAVTANGAAGEESCTGIGGGGGGGSGGAIMLRAGAFRAEDASGTPGSVNVQTLGGAGGECEGAAGGNGGGGLVRIDLPQVDAVATEPQSAFTGPAFLTSDIPIVVTEAELPVAIRGEPGTAYELLITSPDGATDVEVSKTERITTSGPDGVGEQAVVLWQGFNRLCLRAVPNADPDSYPEAANCITVAYIQP